MWDIEVVELSTIWHQLKKLNYSENANSWSNQIYLLFNKLEMNENISEIQIPEYALRTLADEIIEEVKKWEDKARVVELIEQFLSENDKIYIIPCE